MLVFKVLTPVFIIAGILVWYNLSHNTHLYVPPENAPGMHVLFIGNSYTFVNDLPHMVAAVAASDTANPVTLQPGIFAVGGATLEELWGMDDAHNALNSGHWDYVVLQETSLGPVEENLFYDMQKAMSRWNLAIRSARSTPLIFETWARAAGSNWYDDEKYPGLRLGDHVTMQNRIDKATSSIAEQLKIKVVPVGDFWASCNARKDTPTLFNKDGTHPNIAGDYLTALVFYRYLTGHKIDHVTYTPEGLTQQQARLLIECAAVEKN